MQRQNLVKKKIKYVQKINKLQKSPNKQKGKFQNTKQQINTKTKVINVKVKFLRELGYDNLLEWLENQQHVYIGRDMSYYVPGALKSKWANPFKVDKYGRKGCLEQYKKYILNQKNLLQSLKQLKGKTLGCWCKPQDCHGDILVELIEKQ